MNDEYLWQKTGDAAEIARLEKALAVFRYSKTDPPAITPPTIQKSARRWRFPVAFAAAGFAGVLLAMGVWLSPARVDTGYDVTFVHNPVPLASELPVSTDAPTAPEPPPSNPARVTNVGIQPVKAAMRRPSTRQHLRKTPSAALTKQEREAYDRLLLALSISSSKINIVRKAIDGNGDEENTREVNNR